MQDGQERVIAYYSKTINKAEGNYCVNRRELLAIVRTLEHFHKYLYGQQFHLRGNPIPTLLRDVIASARKSCLPAGA
jgi:hypothetical protein